jgi:hypothetical protein
MAVPTLVEEVNGGAVTATDTNIPLTFASTPANDNLIILEYTQDSATPATRTWPAGFTEFIAYTPASGGGIYAAWKIASGEGSATYDIDLGDAGDTGQGLRGQVWTGVDQTTPINVTGSGQDIGFKNDTETYSSGSVTTTVADCALVVLSFDSDQNANGATASGFTELEHDGTPDVTRRMHIAHGSRAGAGAGAVTMTVAGGFFTNMSAILFAIAPPAGTAAITGTATASITEADIVAGGKTIIATLTGETYVANDVTNIELVGRQSGKFAGTTTTQDVNFSLSGGLAAVPAAGDLVFVSYAVGTAGRTPAMVIANTGGTAYTDALPSSIITADDTQDVRLRGAYRFMPGTPETAVRFTSGSGNAADAAAYDIIVLRGIDTGTPLDLTSVEASGTNGHAADPPSITPVTVGAWTYHAGASGAVTSAVHTSSDLSQFLSQAQADTNDVALGAGLLSTGWTSGAQDPAAFGGGGAGTTADSWAAFSVAFRPVVTDEFDNARQDIIDGIDSAQAEGTGWDAEVKANQGVAGVVRTSSTVVTITLDAQAAYDITAQETITVTLPATALSSGTQIIATPTFTVDTAAGGPTTGELMAARQFGTNQPLRWRAQVVSYIRKRMPKPSRTSLRQLPRRA